MTKGNVNTPQGKITTVMHCCFLLSCRGVAAASSALSLPPGSGSVGGHLGSHCCPAAGRVRSHDQ